jgi:hypothetical protein
MEIDIFQTRRADHGGKECLRFREKSEDLIRCDLTFGLLSWAYRLRMGHRRIDLRRVSTYHRPFGILSDQFTIQYQYLPDEKITISKSLIMESIEKETKTPALQISEEDKQTIENIKYYSSKNASIIDARLRELDNEWDIERMIQINAGLAAFSGALLGTFNKKWFVIPGIAAAFLAQHALKGWSPTVSFFRRLGFRSRKEIEKEKYALKTLRGDFDEIYDTADAWRAVKD